LFKQAKYVIFWGQTQIRNPKVQIQRQIAKNPKKKLCTQRQRAVEIIEEPALSSGIGNLPRAELNGRNNLKRPMRADLDFFDAENILIIRISKGRKTKKN
jgi:hypothetical protein